MAASARILGSARVRRHASAALIDDGTAAGRTVIPTDPGGTLTADVDGNGTSNADVDDSSDAYHQGRMTRRGGERRRRRGDMTNAFIDDSEAYLRRSVTTPTQRTRRTPRGAAMRLVCGRLHSRRGLTINDDGSSPRHRSAVRWMKTSGPKGRSSVSTDLFLSSA
jgi:hypothetical protein